MEAMILAAGAGTRLAPLTEARPKALVEVGGRPLLARVMDRLVAAGVTRLVINTHYHEEQILAFLREHRPAPLELAHSPEPEGPLDTGGGLFRAAPLFREDRPFFLHNVDVLSTIPLEELMADHVHHARQGEEIVASLAVQKREADRRLLFDDRGLMGWENRAGDQAPGSRRVVREPSGEVIPWAFTGIHAVDPRIFRLSDRSGRFSIITLYLELAAQGWVIRPWDVSGERWLDVGTPERLAEANRLDWPE